MEPRDAYRRPEVFAFMDARMLGAFVSTSRSAKTAARECDAWSAIARRQHERPTYFGGKPGSNEHMTFLHRTFHAPEFYALEEPGQTDAVATFKRLYHVSEFIRVHSRNIRVVDGDIHNPDPEEDIHIQDTRPLREMTMHPDPGEEFLLLNGRSASPSVPTVADVPELADAIDEFADTLDETELAQLGQAIRALHAARGGPPAWMRAENSDGDDDSDDGDDSEDGDSSMEAILAEAVQRLRS